MLYIFERFHLNHRLAFEEHDTDTIAAIEQRRCELGPKTVLLTISPAIVEQRIQLRTPADWTNRTSEEITAEAERYIAMQERLVAVSEQSLVPTLRINTDELDWNSYARAILDALDEDAWGQGS